jgi:hypothetical protein
VTEIDVVRTEDGDPFVFQVTVMEQTGQTRHRVTLRRTDYERLSGGAASPETLVSESFRFLLEREPKEAILRSFDLLIIGRYFPEFEGTIQNRL